VLLHQEEIKKLKVNAPDSLEDGKPLKLSEQGKKTAVPSQDNNQRFETGSEKVHCGLKTVCGWGKGCPKLTENSKEMRGVLD